MKKISIIALLLLIAGNVAGASQRDTIPMNFDWRFSLGETADAQLPNFDDSGWRQLDLPYDYQLNMPWNKDALQSRGFKDMSGAWFRKTVRPEESWKGRQVMLDFEGLMYYGDVYLPTIGMPMAWICSI